MEMYYKSEGPLVKLKKKKLGSKKMFQFVPGILKSNCESDFTWEQLNRKSWILFSEILLSRSGTGPENLWFLFVCLSKKISLRFDTAGQDQGFKATGFQEILQHYST